MSMSVSVSVRVCVCVYRYILIHLSGTMPFKSVYTFKHIS